MTPSKWGDRPYPREGLDRRNFKNLEYIGTLPTNTRVREGGVNFLRKLVKFSKFSPATATLEQLVNREYATILPNRTTIENSIRKLDARPPFSEAIKFFEYGILHFEHYYKSVMGHCIASTEEIYYWIDMTTSSGYPNIWFGLRKKGDSFKDEGYQCFKLEFNYEDPAYHWVKEKIEVLPEEKIRLDECRLFMIPELLLLENQIKYGKKISLRIKNFRWSAYGFNPYSGGVNRLAHSLLTKRYRFFYDISGWDKFLNILNKVYEVLKKHSGYENFTQKEKQEYDWMIRNTIEMWIVLYDGSVYVKAYGNGSGSGTTTRDNIFAHIIIMATMLYAAYYKKFEKLPSPQLVEAQIIRLFGDDSICAVDEDFDMITEDFARDIFAEFGMKLKYFYGGLDFPIEQMEFLGFSFKRISDDQYIPLYKEQRLAAGLIYEGVNSNTREAVISKTFVLMFMSYPCEHHALFKLYASDLARHFTASGNLTETEKVMCDLILTMSDKEIESAFLGLESTQRPELLQFFLLGLEEEGIKETFLPQHAER